MKETIFLEFNNQVDSFTKDLKGLMQIPSVSDDLASVEKALLYTIEKAKSYNLEAYTVLDNRVGIVEYGSGEEVFGLLVHVDVVAAQQNECDFNAYDLTQHNGSFYGRGIVDDKGPCMMMLYILKIFKELNIKTSRKIRIIIGTQEEVEWTDMNEYVKNFDLPDFGFTPDGEFPIQNAEKGYLDLKLSFEKLNIQNISAGSSLNSIPSKFEATINNQKYQANGKACHSSIPEEGINAIIKGIEQIPKEHYHPMFEFISEYLDDIHGKKMGVYQKSYVNGDILNLTVLSPTLIDMSENKVNLYINFRLGMEDTYEKIISFMESTKATYGFSYEILEFMQPIYINEKLPFIKTMQEEYEKIMNTSMKFDLAFGTSYAKAMPNFVSYGPLLPQAVDTCHEANEQLSIEDLLLAQKIYINSIYELVKEN